MGGTVNDERVLVLMPTARDRDRTVELLGQVDVRAVACADLSSVCLGIREGASAVLLTDDALITDTCGQLAEGVRAQQPWSAIPFVVLARDGDGEKVAQAAMDTLRNVIVVERPVRTATLISVILSALRGRQHQYETRNAILEQRATLEALHRSQAELAARAEELRVADTRKDEFIATLAHELRNPLAPIRTGLDLLLATPQSAQNSSTLAIMQRQLGHMVRLIDDLLDVSRITQGKLELKRERVALEDIINAAVEASRPSIHDHRHTLRVTLPSEPLWLDADLTRIAQTISNLLNNASKYTGPGGEIDLSVAREGDEVAIRVSDNGIGIPNDHLEDVFDMFSQVSRTLERSQGGLGIGLGLVRRLVEMHGGSASAASDGHGTGSTFTIRLPIPAQAPAAVDALSSPDLQAGPKLGAHILVVDDNEDAAEMLSMLLELAGHHARTVNDGASALAAARDSVPEAIILDIGMPGMNGYDVARKLREDDRFSKTALIALTGWGSREDKRKAIDAGFDFHLTKPVDAVEMRRVLSMVSARDGAALAPSLAD
jgi:signal transduction histidine kinase/ActR/RegA family two-component response regulator